MSKPSFVQKPTIKQDGEVLVFECKISGDPKPDFKWFFGHRELQDGGRYLLFEKKSGNAYNVAMEIEDISQKDAGNYKIVAKNRHGECNSSIALNLGREAESESKGMVAPTFMMKPIMKQSDGGKTLIVESEVKATPKPTIKWFKDGKEVTDGGRYRVFEDTEEGYLLLTLEIKDVTDSDEGEYKIVATNQLGQSTSTIKLNFAGEGVGKKKVAPSFNGRTRMKQSEDGHKIIFECDLIAEPMPNIEWYRGDKVVGSKDRYEIVTSKKENNKYLLMFIITNVTPDDAGSWKVIAKNDFGNATAIVNLNFNIRDSNAVSSGSPPTIVGKPIVKLNNHVLTIEININADPKPDPLWYYEGKKIEIGGRYKMSVLPTTGGNYMLSLELPDARLSDSGNYQLTIKNKSGEAVQCVYLTLLVDNVTRKLSIATLDLGQAMDLSILPGGEVKVSAAADGTKLAPTEMRLRTGSMTSGTSTPERRPSKDQGSRRGSFLDGEFEGIPQEAMGRRTKEKPEPPYFIETPSKVRIVEGQSIKFEAKVGGFPKPTVSWYKGNTEIKPTKKIIIRYDEKYDMHIMGLKDCEVKDGGNFTCLIENEHGKDQCSFLLLVQEKKQTSKQDFRYMLKHREVERRGSREDDPDWGELKHLESAKLKTAKPDGEANITRPLKDIAVNEKEGKIRYSAGAKVTGKIRPTWYFNGEDITKDGTGKYKFLRIAEEFTLVISDLCVEDSGAYKIEFGELAESTGTITVIAKPRFSKPLENQDVDEHDMIELTCEVSVPDVSLDWYFKEKERIRKTRRFQIWSEGCLHKLVVNNCGPENSGKYTAKVGDQKTSCYIHVEPEKPPVEFKRQLRDTTVLVTEKVEFVCEVSESDAEVTWKKNGVPLELNNRIKAIKDRYVRRLIIEKAQLSDEGEYLCSCGKKSTNAPLFVQERPFVEISSDLKEVRVAKGQKVEINVKIAGHPTPTATWFKKVIELKPSDRLQFTLVPTLASFVITSAERGDTGPYKVEIKNPVGSVPGSFSIIVMDTPGPPKKIYSTTVTCESVTLEWEPPEDTGNCEIDAYKLEMRDMSSSDWTTVVEHKTENVHTVSNLKEGHKYSFRVSAINQIGTSSPVETSKPILAKDPFDPPSSPSKPVISDPHKNRMTLEWSTPKSDGGSKITGYFIEKREKSKSNWTNILKRSIKETNYVVYDLKEGVEYEFRVIAENKAGLSEPSEPSEFVAALEPIEPADPPGDVKVSDVTKYSLTLSWSVPKKDGGSPILGYIVEQHQTKVDGWERRNKDLIKNTTFKVEGLVEGLEYEFRIFAENKAGLSEPSLATEKIIAEDPKIPPSIDTRDFKSATIKAGQPFKLTIKFTGCPDPTATWSKDGSPLTSTDHLKIEATSTSATLTVPAGERLDTGNYTVEISNPWGTETATADIIVLDKPGPPEGPLEVSEIFAESCVLTWKPPKDDGGEKIRNYIVERKDKQKTSWAPVSSNITGTTFKVQKLTEGIEYLFRVSAENKFGVGPPLETSHEILAKNPYDAPDAPSKPNVTDPHKNSMRLSWSAPNSDGGSPIMGYYVEKREKSTPRWTKIFKKPVEETEQVIRDLSEGIEYEFRVIAENKGGLSNPSEASDFVAALEPIEPADRPNDVVVSDVTKSSLKLNWKAPKSDGGSPITGYVIEQHNTAEDKWERRNKDLVKTTKYIVEELVEGKEYEFRVSAQNEAGLGEPSHVTEKIIAEDPKIPPSIDTSDFKSATLKAGQSFKLSIKFTGCPTPTATWSKNGTPLSPSDHVKIETTPTSTTLNVPVGERLDTGDYDVEISNKWGTEKAKAKIVVKDKPGRPEGPLAVSDVYANSCVLTWKPPKDDGGEKITNYVVERKDTKRPSWTTVSDSVEGTSFKVPKLLEGTEYLFRVSAENNLGISPPLEADHEVLAKNPYDFADAPGTPQITDYDRDYIALAWEPPKKDGGAPIIGYVVEKRDKANNRWVECFDKPVEDSKVTVKDLLPGHDYDFRVAAVNKAGTGPPSEVSATQKAKAQHEKPEIGIGVLKDIKVKAGENFKLEVPFSGEPPPTVKWQKNHKDLAEDDCCSITNADNNTLMSVRKAKRSDSGDYELTLTNDSGSTFVACHVNVLDKPTAPEGPLEVLDVLANSCKLSWNAPKDNGGSEITAYVVEKYDAKSDTWSNISNFVTGTSFNVTKLVEGKDYMFRVRAENAHGDLSEPLVSSKIKAKNPFDAPGEPGKPDIVGYDKDYIEIKWSVPRSDGGNEITGYIIERRDTKTDRWVKANKSPIMSLQYAVKGLTQGKEYQLRVMAENEAGLGKPSPPSKAQIAKPMFEPPEINLGTLREIKVHAGEPLNVDIPIKGSPPPTVTWKKNNEELAYSDAVNESDAEHAKLSKVSAQRKDTGIYTLQVENDQGSASADIKITVLDKPGAPEGPLSYSEFDKNSLKLSWKKPLDDGGTDVSGYKIEMRKASDRSGNWTNVADNIVGTRYTVKNLEEFQDYVFRVSAVNQFGAGEPLVGETVKVKLPFDAPGSPGKPEIMAYDRTSISLSWTKPDDDGGDPIMGYIVEFREEDSRDWVRANPHLAKDVKYSVNGLTEGREYRFRVKGENGAGPGEPSKVSESCVARIPIFAPEAPGKPNIEKVRKDKITISWTKANDGGSELLGYVIEKKSGKKGNWQKVGQVGAKDTRYTVPDLVEGNEYEFRIRGVNAIGEGDPSLPSQVVTAEDVPERPFIDVSDLNDVKIRAGETFTLFAPFEGCPVPTITWEQTKQDTREVLPSDRITIDNQEESTKLTVTDASRMDGGRYELILKNASGQDSAKVKVIVLDAPYAPGGPVTASDINADSLVLHWKPPKIDPEDVDNYIVEKCEEGSNEWTSAASNFSGGNNVRVRGLKEGQGYKFRVIAENQFGKSKPLVSETFVAKNPFDVPGSPGEPKATQTTANSITIAWSKPQKDGGSPITGYMIYKREQDKDKWVEANRTPVRDTAFTVPRLSEGKTYEFQVRAVNEAGLGPASETSAPIKAAPQAVMPKIPFDMKHREIQVKAGKPFRIDMPFEGSPAPVQEWFKTDNVGKLQIQPSDRVSFEENMNEISLLNKCAQRDDSGKYELVLKNEKGSDTAQIRIKVVDVPDMPQGPLEVSDVTAETCVLTWKPPKDDGGCVITNYVVEKRPKNSSKWSKVSSFIKQPHFEVSDLEEGKEYYFRVCAENDLGKSEPLEGEAPVLIRNPYEKPNSPGKPVVEQVDNGFVQLSWSPPPSDGGSRIMGYIVEKRENGNPEWSPSGTHLVKGTTMSVSGLPENVQLEFRVQAKNSAGLGKPSSPSDAIFARPSYKKPSPPGIPDIKRITKSSMDLEWTKPKSDGGSRITNYIVEMRESPDGEWSKATIPTIREPHCTVNGLQEGNAYEFRVRAQNAGGISEPSSNTLPTKAKDPLAGNYPEFTKLLKSQNGIEGDLVKFECEISGNPSPEATWYHQDVELLLGSRIQSRKDGDKLSLTINELRVEDAGDYKVEIKNKHGKEYSNARLAIQRPPKMENIKDFVGELGNSLKIKIRFTASGDTTAEITKDGKPISDNRRMKVQVFDNMVQILINELNDDDDGGYKIKLTNEYGSDIAPLRIKVLTKPGPPRGPLDASEVTKNSITVSWKPPADNGGSPIKNYVVERKEGDKPDWITIGSFVKATTFTAQGLQEGESYLFRIRAENDIGIGEALVGSSPIVAENPFGVPSKPGVPSVTEIGVDFVSLSWQKPESDGGSRIFGYIIEKTEAGADRWVRFNQHPVPQLIYNIDHLIEDRQYEFRVYAANEAGLSEPSSNTNKVTIKDPKAFIRPQFVKQLKDQIIVQGKSAEFECEVTGSPRPETRWLKGSRELFPGAKYFMEESGDKHKLTILNVFGEDADDYTCEASNRGGKKMTRAQLLIKCPPKIKLPPRFKEGDFPITKGETVKLKIPITGYPKPTSSWSREGTKITTGIETGDRHSTLTIKNADKSHEGVYNLSAENDLGSDSALITIIVMDKPEAPTNLRASDIDHETISLAWNAPLNDGGSHISGYVIERRDEGMDNWSRVGATAITAFNMGMMTRNKKYQFRIHAENLFGASGYTECEHEITTPEPKKIKKLNIREEERKSRLEKVDNYDLLVNRTTDFVLRKINVNRSNVYDRYEFGEELGKGEFGRVYRCMDKISHKNYAAWCIDVKNKKDKEVLRQWIDTMSKLQYNKLLQLQDAYETDTQIILIMEFIAGGDIFERIASKKTVSEELVAMYVRQICEALDFMHTHNYMHLHLKPVNILCETKSGDNIKLVDFSFVTKLDPEERLKLVYNSPEYAAPEILNGGDIGFSTDMWTVGLLSYMLLSGIHPFGGKAERVKTGEWAFDTNAFSDISKDAQDFISKLLMLDNSKRITAQEALSHPWLHNPRTESLIRTEKHQKLMASFKWDFGTTVIGIGRLPSLCVLKKAYPGEAKVFTCGMDRREAGPRFIKRPINMIVKEDDPITFSCKITAPTAPLITWWKDGNELQQSLKYRIKYDNMNYALVVGLVQMVDQGAYTVKAKNSYGEIEHTVNLEVKKDPNKEKPLTKKVINLTEISMPEKQPMRPDFEFKLRDRFPQIGDTLKLSCIVQGHPEPQVEWSHNGRRISDKDSSISIAYSHGMATLLISSLKKENGGRYKCTATNKLGEAITEATIDVVETKRQRRKKYSLDMTAASSESTINGFGRTYKSASISVSGGVGSTSYSQSYKSSSLSLRRGDAGSTLQNITQSYESSSSPISETEEVIESSESSDITDKVGDSVMYKGPILLSPPKSIIINVEENAKFTAEVDKNVAVTWSKNGQAIDAGEHYKLLSEENIFSLEILSVVSEDSGMYSFKAWNEYGECEARFSLQVN